VSEASKNAFFPSFFDTSEKRQMRNFLPFSPIFFHFSGSGGSGGKCFFLWVFRRIAGGRRRLALLGGLRQLLKLKPISIIY
jgi:hypothetical protein